MSQEKNNEKTLEALGLLIIQGILLKKEITKEFLKEKLANEKITISDELLEYTIASYKQNEKEILQAINNKDIINIPSSNDNDANTKNVSVDKITEKKEKKSIPEEEEIYDEEIL